LPDLIEQAHTAELKKGLTKHLEETQTHISRLDTVFAALGEEAKGVRCKGIDGILSEGSELIGNSEGRSVIEAAVIASAQAVEHYEITRYGDLIAWASQLGREDVVKLLQQNLRDEKAADKKLTAVAESKINRRADRTHRTRRSSGSKRTSPRPRRKSSASAAA